MLSLILIFVASLYFMGIIAQTKAKLSGRKGPGVFQFLFDVSRLLRKGNVYSNTTSIIFQIAPMIYASTILCAILIIPFNNTSGLLSFQGDFVIFTYLLALGKFFMIAAALDTGSSFEGMGANREALYSMLVEPAFFIMIGSFAMLTGHSSFHEIYASINYNSYFSYFLGVLAIYLLAQIAMVENSRLPVDDPKTHLELTMVHEVMVLDTSGFDLGVIQLVSALKFTMYGALICNLILPISSHLIINVLVFFIVQFFFAVWVGLMESFRARLKISSNPMFLLMLTAISIVIFFTAIILTEKADTTAGFLGINF